MEARFSLPILSAGGDLLPDPTAIARANRQVSLPETPGRALPIPPTPQSNVTKPARAFYEARDMPFQARPGQPVSPRTVIEDPVFTSSPIARMVDSEPEHVPNGFQAQPYSVVQGFNHQCHTFSTLASEKGPLHANASQPPSSPLSPGSPRHYGYAQVPPVSLPASPLSSPTASKSTQHSIHSCSGSPSVPCTPGPFAWATSAAITSPAKSTAKYASPVSRQPNHPIAVGHRVSCQAGAATPVAKPYPVPTTASSGLGSAPMALVLNPPARSSSHLPVRGPRPGPHAFAPEATLTKTSSPLHAPEPIVPPVQLSSQGPMAMFDDCWESDHFSESGDGYSTPTPPSQEQLGSTSGNSLELVESLTENDSLLDYARTVESLVARSHNSK
ncbi:hypothetical protein CspeluHIS016_0703350 [Cutaneotrichosporon spelunceum]|uniref:Uncharacterized protein n=1 Tax=Cutaneotrichosporon spelunceum TaxID=1672016 RepID=A0AAD3TZG5_9TREE|nr:hypothetical protein CspeluHIS016_0703350 [Cutaneotrichosporon spelunceum]